MRQNEDTQQWRRWMSLMGIFTKIDYQGEALEQLRV